MFYYKILVWLFWVVLSFITGCVPLILLILLVGLWEVEEADKRHLLLLCSKQECVQINLQSWFEHILSCYQFNQRIK